MSVLRVKGKPLAPGTICTITGERGRFRFQYPTWSSEHKLILNFVGGVAGHECFRSFYAERVKKVYG